jgi:hypothetical protein
MDGPAEGGIFEEEAKARMLAGKPQTLSKILPRVSP